MIRTVQFGANQVIKGEFQRCYISLYDYCQTLLILITDLVQNTGPVLLYKIATMIVPDTRRV